MDVKYLLNSMVYSTSCKILKRNVETAMPIFEIKNANKVEEIAEELKLPEWLVKALIVEYLSCRQFQGSTVIIDYGLVTPDDLNAIAIPRVILNGLVLFHNVTKEVLYQRVISGIGGVPMSSLSKQEACYLPEGKVSPHRLPNPNQK